jgi:cytochrome c oxidase assembly protein subunit 15
MPSRSAERLRRLSPFQRLAIATTATTYLLILVGGLVRASGAGLGCPDWPRCFGSWIPPLSAADLPAPFDASQFNPRLMWTEYLNRLLGVTVGFLILATLVSAIRHHRDNPRIVWGTAAAFLLVGFEGWLGGVVVREDLAAWIVTAHLIVALVIVSLLLYVTVYAFFVNAGRPESGARAVLVWSTFAVLVMTLVQIGIGAQVRGGIDEALSAGAARSAAILAVGDLAVSHRNSGTSVMLGALGLVMLVLVKQEALLLTRVAFAIVALTAAQLVLGLAMVTNLKPVFQVLHLILASLLLGAETLLLLLARWLPGSDHERFDDIVATRDADRIGL